MRITLRSLRNLEGLNKSPLIIFIEGAGAGDDDYPHDNSWQSCYMGGVIHGRLW